MNSTAVTHEVVKLVNVSKMYCSNSHETRAIRDLTLSIESSELVLLLGPSGSGKTTLLTLMAGLISPTSGDVVLFGRNIRGYSEGDLQRLRAEKLGFIFQNFLLIDSLTVLENLLLVLQFGGKGRSESRQRAQLLLTRFGIVHLSEKHPGQLSQGEKQRVAIARAIANSGELILADEPTASLESSQGLEIIELLQRLAKEENKCVVVASHDLRLTDCADRVVRMRDGEIESCST